MPFSSTATPDYSFVTFIEHPITLAFGWIIGVYIVYRLGLRAYFLRKEAEYLRVRYLEQGFDQACAQLDYALSIHRANWKLFLRYLKLCRELPNEFDSSDFFEQFRELDESHFQLSAMHRIVSLLIDDVLWNTYQRTFSFVATRNDMIKADFGSALTVLAAKPLQDREPEAIEVGSQLAADMSDESNKFYVFLSKLNDIAKLFERRKLDRKSIKDFVNIQAVQDILASMRKDFPDNSIEMTTEEKE